MIAVLPVDWGPAAAVWACCLIAGLGLMRGFGFKGCGPERLGIGLLVGAAVLAGLTTALSLGAWVSGPALGGGLIAIGLLGFYCGRGQRTTCEGGWLAFAPALLMVAFGFMQAAAKPVHNVDAQRRWVLHGQWTAQYGTAIPDEVQHQSFGTSHPSYPPLVTGMTALALEFGADRDWGIRPLFPVFLIGLLGSLFGFARRRAGPLAAGLVTAGLALVPALSFTSELGLGSAAAHGDLALAAYLTGLCALLLDRFEKRDSVPIGALAVLALGTVWVKNEGAAFALVMLLATAILMRVMGRKLANRDAGSLFGIALLGTLFWKIVARNMPVATGEDYVSGGVVNALSSGLDRVPTILGRMAQEALDFELWGPIWLLIPVWLVLRKWRDIEREHAANLNAILPALWLLLGLGLVVAAYVATGWKDGRYEALMDVSLARLMAHHAPLVAIMMVELLAKPSEQESNRHSPTTDPEAA